MSVLVKELTKLEGTGGKYLASILAQMWRDWLLVHRIEAYIMKQLKSHVNLNNFDRLLVWQLKNIISSYSLEWNCM